MLHRPIKKWELGYFPSNFHLKCSSQFVVIHLYFLFDLCLSLPLERDRDPDTDSRDPSLEQSQEVKESTGKAQVLHWGILENLRLASVLGLGLYSRCPSMSGASLLHVSSGSLPCEDLSPASGWHSEGQHFSHLGHNGIVVHAGHGSHLIAFGIKSHEFQFLQIFQDDDIIKAFFKPCGPGRWAAPCELAEWM